MSQRIGFLGTGRIAEPMVQSLDRRFPDAVIHVTERSRAIAESLALLPTVTVADNQAVVDASDTVFLCLLADVARSVLPGLRFRPDQAIISVMADISLAEVADLVAPAVNPAVTIPLPFIASGGCPLPVFPASEVLAVLFGDENEVITVAAEAAMGPHFAATAVLSHTMKQLDTVAGWLASHAGNRQDAERYVAGLVSGYLGVLAKDGNGRFREAMEELSTEGGLNNQLRGIISDSGFYRILEQGLDQLAERLAGNAGGR